jgi:hypothetical protein
LYHPPQVRRDFLDAITSIFRDPGNPISNFFRAFKTKFKDIFTWREDDTDLGGISSEDCNEEWFLTRGSLDNTVKRDIPIHYRGILKNQEELMLDFSSAVLYTANTAINYACLSEVKETVEFLSNYIKDITPKEYKGKKLTAELVQRVSEDAKEAYSEYENEFDIEPTVPAEDEPSDEMAYSCFAEGFDSSFKAYMDYRCITDTGSVQYNMQQQAYTDERGFRRIGDDYCVALGTGFTNGCGERFIIGLDSGYSFTAIVSDVKADYHTDSTNCYAPRGENSGNVVEFIIDTDNADDYMLTTGTAGCFEDLSGNIISITKI